MDGAALRTAAVLASLKANTRETKMPCAMKNTVQVLVSSLAPACSYAVSASRYTSRRPGVPGSPRVNKNTTPITLLSAATLHGPPLPAAPTAHASELAMSVIERATRSVSRQRLKLS